MKVRDLKKGMVVWECEAGMNARIEVLEDAYRDVNLDEGRDGHSCKVRGEYGEMELFQTENEKLHHYGPHLYLSPQYVRGAGR